jgi:hypothetical protein
LIAVCDLQRGGKEWLELTETFVDEPHVLLGPTMETNRSLLKDRVLELRDGRVLRAQGRVDLGRVLLLGKLVARPDNHSDPDITVGSFSSERLIRVCGQC